MSRPLPAARKRLLRTLIEDWKALVAFDEKTDAKAGSPNPILTAVAESLATGISFVRITLAHSGASELFEEALSMARERELDGWNHHRARCERCGGH